MANELLKFRKGLYADLADVAKDPGTIYVTTDEQAMYVDIDANTRIRLGETVHFATLASFQDFLKGTKPPYNPQAFYYIDSENALLKWVSSGGTYNPDVDGDGIGDSNGSWKQINSTAALTAEINGIKNRISTIETEQATQNTNIIANSNAITRIDGEIGETNGSTEGSLWKAIKENKAAIESNDGDITNLQNNKLDKTTFNDYKTEVTNSFNAVNNKLGSSADTTNNKTAFQRIEALETSNDTKATQADLEELNKTVYGSADRTETDAGLVKKVAALETNSATKAALKEATDDIAEHDTAIANLRKDLGTTTDASTVTTTAFGRIKKLEESIGDGTGESLSGRVQKLETIVGDTTSGLVKDVDDIQAALGNKANPAAGTIYKEIADIKVKDGQQDTSIANLEKVLNGNAAGTTQDEKDGVLKRLSAVEDQANAIDAELGDKVSGTTGNTVWAAVKDAQDKGTAALGQIGTKAAGTTGNTLWEAVKNAQSAASTNATNITEINSEIGNADGSEAGTLWNAIKTNATDIDTLERTIANEINAANGMTYKGGVGSAANISGITAPEVGDTYVATQAFTFTQEDKTVQVYAGDLLVASGTETNGVITSNLKWTVVNTGYIQAHEATLGVVEVPNKGAQINLNSYVSGLGDAPNSGDLGKVKIVSDNLIITSTYDDATKTSEIKINAVWGDFGSTT